MSSSPDRPSLQVLLIASEAMWITLCLSVIANTWPHFSMSVPYWALLLPALAALGAGHAARRVGPTWKSRLGLAIGAGVVILMLGAGLLASASSVPFAQVAFTPWTVTAAHSSSITTLSWFDVSLVVARAIQVSLTSDHFARTIRSVVIASVAYFSLFITIATQHSVRLTHATHFIEPIFLAYFLIALIMLRMSRASDIERPVDANQAPATGGTWKVVLALPLVLVGIVAFFLAGLLGASGAGLRHALLDIANAIAWFFVKIWQAFAFVIVHIALGIVAVISFFVNLFIHRHHEGPLTKVVHKAATKVATTPTSHVPLGLTAGLMAVFGIAVIIGLRYLVKNHLGLDQPISTTPDDGRSSTFSWRNFGAQILNALRMLFTWLTKPLRRSKPLTTVHTGSNYEEIGELRRDYLRILIAARSARLGRSLDETPLEFARRLGETVANGQFHEAMEAVTRSYQNERYREHPATSNPIEPELVELVIAELLIQEMTLPPETDDIDTARDSEPLAESQLS